MIFNPHKPLRWKHIRFHLISLIEAPARVFEFHWVPCFETSVDTIFFDRNLGAVVYAWQRSTVPWQHGTVAAVAQIPSLPHGLGPPQSSSHISDPTAATLRRWADQWSVHFLRRSEKELVGLPWVQVGCLGSHMGQKGAGNKICFSKVRAPGWVTITDSNHLTKGLLLPELCRQNKSCFRRYAELTGYDGGAWVHFGIYQLGHEATSVRTD